MAVICRDASGSTESLPVRDLWNRREWPSHSSLDSDPLFWRANLMSRSQRRMNSLNFFSELPTFSSIMERLAVKTDDYCRRNPSGG